MSKALYNVSSLGFLVRSETITVINTENTIQITPIVGEQEMPHLIISASVPVVFSGCNAPKMNMSEAVKVRAAEIDAQTAGFVTLFQRSPITKGPINQPESVPQLMPIKYAIAVKLNFSFRIASTTEIMMNTRQSARITQFTFLSFAFLFIAPL